MSQFLARRMNDRAGGWREEVDFELVLETDLPSFWPLGRVTFAILGGAGRGGASPSSAIRHVMPRYLSGMALP